MFVITTPKTSILGFYKIINLKKLVFRVPTSHFITKKKQQLRMNPYRSFLPVLKNVLKMNSKPS